MTEAGDRVRADVARNRTAILMASVDVLSREPQASLAQIAAGAGVGRATLYRHFPSREALLEALREELLARASTVVASARPSEGPPLEALRRVISRLLPLGLAFRGLVADGIDLDPAFRDARDEVLRPAYELLERAVVDGAFRSGITPSWAASVLSGLLVGAVRESAASGLSSEEAADLVHSTLLHGLGG